MKVLITGSSGFIGKSFVDYIKVYESNIVEINRERGFDLSLQGWTKKINEDDVDVVIHLAQSNNFREAETYANEIFATNVSATQEILEWSIQNNVKRFIYTSTFNVYNELDHTMKSENSLLQPNTYYALTKYLSESLIKHYSEKLETIILRLNTVYGRGQKKSLIPNIINRISEGQEVYLAKGKGLILAPLYVSDLCKILHQFLNSRDVFSNSVFNVSSNENVSLFEIVNHLGTILDRTPRVKFTNDTVINYSSNPSKLLEFLGADFKFTYIKHGLKKSCL